MSGDALDTLPEALEGDALDTLPEALEGKNA
jgi:hypothetical protein